MTIRAITANLGCGGPDRATYSPIAEDWRASIADSDVGLLFLQEIPSSEWLEGFGPSFSTYTAGSDLRSFRCRSAIVVRNDALRSEPLTIPTADFHASYLAGATIELGNLGWVACVSVHASPTPLREEHERNWVGPRPEARRGAGQHAGKRFDSDYVLATLARLHTTSPVLAAGDFNEARQWDLAHPGEWGADYFAAVKANGFIDCLNEIWPDEQPTYRELQLDHVLASQAGMVASATINENTPSDHRLVEFTIRTD